MLPFMGFSVKLCVSLRTFKMITMSKEYVRMRWASGEAIKLRGKSWKIGKMSYGAYFLEPKSYKGGERDPFHPETLWLQKKDQNNFSV